MGKQYRVYTSIHKVIIQPAVTNLVFNGYLEVLIIFVI